MDVTISNTSNKWKASRQWIEGWWREMIDYKSNRPETLCWGLLYQIQAILSRCCIKYKQLVKGQKDNGRRETQRMINKQKNKSCLFVNLFGCFHDSEHDIVQHFCWLAGLLLLALGLKVGKCLKTWYQTSFPFVSRNSRNSCSQSVLLDAPLIPAGMWGFRWNPLEFTGIGPESTGMKLDSTGITIFLQE